MTSKIELWTESESGRVTLRSPVLGLHQPWSHTRTLIARLLAAKCVGSVILDRSRQMVTIQLTEDPHGRSASPTDFSEIARQLRSPSSDDLISDEYSRFGQLHLQKSEAGITSGTVVHSVPGRLRIRHPLIRWKVDDSHLKRDLGLVPGVKSVTTSSMTGSVLIIFDDASLKASELVARVERSLTGRAAPISVLNGPPASRWIASATCLGLAVASEFVTPGLAPVTAAALVGFNVPTMVKGIAELCTFKWRVASLYTVIMGTTLISGQFLAAALMQASITCWHGWSSRRLKMIAEKFRSHTELPIVIGQSHLKCLVNGQRFPECLIGSVVNVERGTILPYDGIVVSGEGDLDERSVRGMGSDSHRRTGDQVFAGSHLTQGRLEVRVTAVENQTRVSKVRETLFASIAELPGSGSPTKRGHESASRFVPLTFATGTAAMLVGDLTTLAAVLRPDFATGPSISERFGTLSSISHLWDRGWLVRNSEILHELARVENVVIFHPTTSKLNQSIECPDESADSHTDVRSSSPNRRDVRLTTRSLAIDEIHGDPELFLDFVRRLQPTCRRLAVVAPGFMLSQLAGSNLIRISLTPDESLSQTSVDLIALHSEPGQIEDLWRVLQEVRRPLKQGWAAVVVCNALAISGAFLVGLTSLHVVVLTNLGALAAGALYNQHLRRSSQLLTSVTQTAVNTDVSQGSGESSVSEKPSANVRPSAVAFDSFSESWDSRRPQPESPERRPRQSKKNNDPEVTVRTSLT